MAKLKPEFGGHWEDTSGNAYLCPYGIPKERLWVREKWADVRGMGFDHQKLPGAKMEFAYHADATLDGLSIAKDLGVKWRPSIHMPRRLCRITLEIIGVRVERLQEISEADARAEGMSERRNEARTSGWGGGDYPQVPMEYTFRWAFAELWDSLNGDYKTCGGERPRGWVANPWVWVLDFKKVEQ